MATQAASLVRAMLEEHRHVVQAALRKYVAERESESSHLYELVADYPERGGRALRASLCLASACAFGAEVEDAIGAAVALELMHNAFLVHDDIEDGSVERRGKPTLHVLHGMPIAVNVGDALAVLSLRPLLASQARLGPRLTLRVLEEAERMARESVEGQALELHWRDHNQIALSEDDYLKMILKKTCWYTTIYPCRVGALIGTRDGVDLDRFLRFGFFLGAAFQIQDDLLNLTGDPERYGKERDGDLYEGKRTLMLIRLFEVSSPAEREQWSAILQRSRSERTREDVAQLRAGMDRYGCIEHARKVAHGLAGAAMHELQTAYGDLPDSRHKEFLTALPVWMLERA